MIGLGDFYSGLKNEAVHTAGDQFVRKQKAESNDEILSFRKVDNFFKIPRYGEVQSEINGEVVL